MAKILVVDDESGYLELLDIILKAGGHEVQTAQSPENAVELGQAFCPDVLLADWKLKSDLNGLDVARKLRDENKKLVTIIMTGYSSAMLRSQAPDIRNLYVLEKPFDTDALQDVINQAVGM